MRMSYLVKSMLLSSAFGLSACGGDSVTKIVEQEGEAPNAVVYFKGKPYTENFTIEVEPGSNEKLDASNSSDKETASEDLEYYWSSNTPSGSTYTLNYPSSDAGKTNVIALYVMDEQNNSSEIITVTVKVKDSGTDPVTSKPELSLSSSSGEIKVDADKTIAVTVDGADEVTYSIDGGTETTLSGSSITINASGKSKGDTIELVVTATNEAGSTKKTASFTVTDEDPVATKPELSLSSSGGDIKVDTEKTIDVTVDGADEVTYSIDGGTEKTLSGSSITIDASGKSKGDTIELVVTATNDEGSTVKTATFTVTEDDPVTVAPEISLSATSGDIEVDTTKDITVSLTGDEAVVTYSIDGGDAQALSGDSITIDATGKAKDDEIELVVSASNAGGSDEVKATFTVTEEVIIPDAPVLSIDVDAAEIVQDDTLTVEVTVEGEEPTTVYSVDGGDDVETTDKTISIEIDATGKAAGDKIELVVNSSNEGGAAEELTATYTVKAKDIEPVAAEFTWDNALIYFVIPDRFENGNPSNDNSYGRQNSGISDIGTFHGGDIKGLTSKLDYLEELGINAIWITAPYEQIHGYVGGGDNGDFPHYAYHGYYPLDFTMIDQNMGTVEEFRTFVDSAHAKGIRVVMDVVMNHAGYNTLIDGAQYGFGGVSMSLSDAQGYMDSGNYHGFHSNFDYDNGDWSGWWSDGWIRAGVKGYTAGGNDDLTKNLNFLPDFKTEQSNSVGLAPVLATKWGMESSGYDDWIIPAASSLRTDLGVAPADYIAKWLVSWVEEFGIDGFRVDTAKHVEQYRWKQLKEAGKEALATWRANSSDPAASWTDEFWMTGEHWNFGFGDDMGYFSNGFDSMINFGFKGSASSLASNWQDYADRINSDAGYNVLSYISSHDTALTRGDMITIGTNLILLPGGVQIFYGDETERAFGATGSDPLQGTRSAMNWGENSATLSHWQKLGQFRRNNPAVGAGTQENLGSDTYGRKWTSPKTGNENKVVIVINASGTVDVNVDGYFADGTEVRNAYDGEVATVSGGKVSFAADNGVILVEAK